MGKAFFPNVTLTNAIYQASKAPAVRALYPMITGEARDKQAQELAQAGYLLDVSIDVWGWDAVTTMAVRKQFGATWEPSALQAPLNGAVGTGTPPPGSIKVSVDAADYPPFDPPPPPPIVDTHVVGRVMFGNIYTYAPGAVKDGKYVVIDGQIVEQDGVHYKAHVNQSLIGVQVYFEKIA